VSVEVVFVGPRLAAGDAALLRAERLRAKHTERVQFRTIALSAGLAALRACANEADLLVLGLGAVWGLDVERASGDSGRILAELPTSLLVLHARPT